MPGPSRDVVTSELSRAIPLPAPAAGDFKTLAPHLCLGLGEESRELRGIFYLLVAND